MNSGDQHSMASKELISLVAILKKPLSLKRGVSLYTEERGFTVCLREGFDCVLKRGVSLYA